MADDVRVGIVVGARVGSGVDRAFGRVEKGSRGVGDALARTNKRADRHRQELRRLRAEQARTGDESGDLSRQIRGVGEVLRRTTARAAGFRRELKSIQRVERARATAGRTALVGGAAIGVAYAATRLIGDAGIAHERAAAELRTVVQTDAEVGAALGHARERVRAGGGVDETEQVAIHYELSSAGLSAEEARVGAVIAEHVATATRGVPDETAKALATTYRQFRQQLSGTTEENLRRVGDVLTATQFAFQLSDLNQLSEGFTKAATRAKDMNLSLDQTAALVGFLNSEGYAGSEAGTAAQAILRQLLPAQEKLRFRLVRNKEGGLELADTLAALNEALPEDIDKRAALIQKTFGDEGPRSRRSCPSSTSTARASTAWPGRTASPRRRGRASWRRRASAWG